MNEDVLHVEKHTHAKQQQKKPTQISGKLSMKWLWILTRGGGGTNVFKRQICFFIIIKKKYYNVSLLQILKLK